MNNDFSKYMENRKNLKICKEKTFHKWQESCDLFRWQCLRIAQNDLLVSRPWRLLPTWQRSMGEFISWLWAWPWEHKCYMFSLLSLCQPYCWPDWVTVGQEVLHSCLIVLERIILTRRVFEKCYYIDDNKS